MCFSATASFGASAILFGIGLLSIKNSESSAQKYLASIPLMLSIQQILEGILWLSISNPAYLDWVKPSTYGFLLFAQVIWPIFIPLTLMLLEKEAIRKKILMIFLALGVLQAIFMGYGLFFFPAESSISGSHIRYDMDFPAANTWYGGVFYILATGFSPFVSSIKRISLIGVIILFTYLFTRIFYGYYVISIWCYFAALISFAILFVSLKLKKEGVIKVSLTE
ncbi:hypothetical protein SAMN05421813_102201 [Daejeonella rubra]|uniref:Uncharacterized protein n=1 Tax=Daejeonella rubra TaxID=990371 RepID=A0A1G9N234_9SPHI|nr:DUF6629 family protein [Daejeonella rubra]SDL80444.1 hypothetical protein SAMN05421813_102201 [Daejeonella rubra]